MLINQRPIHSLQGNSFFALKHRFFRFFFLKELHIVIIKEKIPHPVSCNKEKNMPMHIAFVFENIGWSTKRLIFMAQIETYKRGWIY